MTSQRHVTSQHSNTTWRLKTWPGKITTNLYVHTAREDLVDKFVSLYEAAYAVDEHRTLNFSKVLKKLTLTRSGG